MDMTKGVEAAVEVKSSAFGGCDDGGKWEESTCGGGGG